MYKVFIDGSEGTTGLRIFERFEKRDDIELIKISSELRKDPDERRRMFEKADIAFLCLPDVAAIESAELAKDADVKL
ncbi:MAG: N-acetyl-gamma-glutamyl-phosphate reductase, partial [Clostridia bacterium]|nr:N-acetyl-gamma-glutamyl-phosphate reductase [Clostridia bacterium]